MAIEVPQNEEISEGKNGGRKEVGSAIGANRGGGGTLKKESEEKLLGEMLNIIRVGMKRKKRGGRKFRKR